MKRSFVISISGLSGSGKTAVTNALRSQLANTAVINFDDYGDSVYLDRDINDWSVATCSSKSKRVVHL